MKVKTIDIHAKEWFDKVNGNSYFSGTVVVNYKMKNEKSYEMPFQYGYGDAYIQEAAGILQKEGICRVEKNLSLWRWCDDNNVILRNDKQENCRKREL